MSFWSIFDISLIHATIRASTPIIFAALAAVISSNAGILNVGIEGGMLTAAFTAIAVNSVTGSWILGVLAAVAACEIYSAVIAAAHLKFHADVFAVGTIMNIMALGLTSFLLEILFDVSGKYVSDSVQIIPSLSLKIFSGNAVLNSIFNNYSVFEILAVVMIAVIYFLLYRTIWGLRVRGAGLHDEATLTAGINPVAKKWQAILVSGILVGLGGAYMSTSYVNMFVEDMISGRGFMGLAAMFFGKSEPVLSSVGCLVFGFTDSVGARLQYLGIYPQFIQMIPYIVTVVIYAASMYFKGKKNRKMNSAVS
ncbi:MAG: ABC transporter permease [Lachnospiraceae bacterium]